MNADKALETMNVTAPSFALPLTAWRAERRVILIHGRQIPTHGRKWIEDNVKFTLEESGVF